MGDPTYRAPVQRPSIHGNGEGLFRKESQCGVQKALVGPRVNEDLERFGLVSSHQNDMKRGASKGSRKVLIQPTSVSVPNGEPVLLPGKRT
jgi:hypothetical protein